MNNSKALKRFNNKNKIITFIIENLFMVCAMVSVLAVAIITIFIFYSGIPGIIEIGVFKFIGKVPYCSPKCFFRSLVIVVFMQ